MAFHFREDQTVGDVRVVTNAYECNSDLISGRTKQSEMLGCSQILMSVAVD